jgi:predicted DNA-binding protein (UPF0251 family)
MLLLQGALDPGSKLLYYEYISITMPRPRKCRCIMHEPNTLYFKPRGIPMVSLTQVEITFDELEAVRLNDLEGHSQTEAAKTMNISQPTLNRTLMSARTKIADALVNGKALRIEGGTYKLIGKKEPGDTGGVSA